MAPSRYDWKIVDWDVKPQHNQPISAYIQFLFSLSWSTRHIMVKDDRVSYNIDINKIL